MHDTSRHRPLIAAAILITALLAGCASFGERPSAGERVAYHVFNRTSALQIMMPELIDAKTGRVLYANLRVSHPSHEGGRSGSWVWSESGNAIFGDTSGGAIYDAFGQRLPSTAMSPSGFAEAPASEPLMLPRPAAGAFQSAPDSHRLPSTVLLSWRAPAMPGQQRFKGSMRGPIRLALRAAMPANVLDRLAQSSRHRLEVAIGASSTRPVIVWRLTNIIDDDVEVLARGSVDAVRLTSPGRRH